MPRDPEAREKWLLKKDLKLYKKYLRKASNKGDMIATFKLAMHSLHSTHENNNFGIALMEKLIKCQNEVIRLRSSYEYGKMLFEGKPIKEDQKKGMLLLLKTARRYKKYFDVYFDGNNKMRIKQMAEDAPHYFHARKCLIYIRKACNYITSTTNIHLTLDENEQKKIKCIIENNENLVQTAKPT